MLYDIKRVGILSGLFSIHSLQSKPNQSNQYTKDGPLQFLPHRCLRSCLGLDLGSICFSPTYQTLRGSPSLSQASPGKEVFRRTNRRRRSPPFSQEEMVDQHCSSIQASPGQSQALYSSLQTSTSQALCCRRSPKAQQQRSRQG